MRTRFTIVFCGDGDSDDWTTSSAHSTFCEAYPTELKVEVLKRFAR